jgi:hypothetical protein
MMLGRRLPPALLHRNALCPYARWFEFLVPKSSTHPIVVFAIPHFNASKSVAAVFVFLVTHQFFFFLVLLTRLHCLTFLLYFVAFFCARIIICVS